MRPNSTQSQPTTMAAPSEATRRASAMRWSLGNATHVEASTMGLTAGAASKNVNAAAGGTPLRMSPLATGTDAHSQPGRSIPAAPATGTASARLRGSARWARSAGTKATIAADRSTPSTRNGVAWTMIDRNTVAKAEMPVEADQPLIREPTTTITATKRRTRGREKTLRTRCRLSASGWLRMHRFYGWHLRALRR